jgi:hypothetical protein
MCGKTTTYLLYNHFYPNYILVIQQLDKNVMSNNNV